MAIRPIQRILQHEPEISSTAMPVDSPPRKQPAPSPSRSLLHQIERRLADCEAAQAHRETPQRGSQLEQRLHHEIAALCQQLQAVATLQMQQAQVTSTLQHAVETHDQGLPFVASHTAHMTNAVAQQCPRVNAPPGGPPVEQDAHMTPHKRSISPSIPVNPKLPPYDGSTDLSLWIRQGNAAVEAYHTPSYQHLRWLVTLSSRTIYALLVLQSGTAR